MAGIGDQIKSAGKNVSKMARKTTGAFSEWWDEVNAINDRRARVRDLARERERLLVEMGTKVYTLHRRAKVQNRDLLGDCERIDTIGDTIDRLEHEIAELKRGSVEARPREIEVTDDAPIVADEDIEEVVGAAPEIEPEVETGEPPPCVHAQTPAEGPVEDDEADGDECIAAHAQDPSEGPADEAGVVDTSATEVPPVEPQFGAAPAGDPTEPEVMSEGSGRCAHADDPAEGPADDDDSATRPGCED
ncbi:MAG: hypothetical protein ACOX9R_12750 [Armatimonadota bacterium]|jgi:hypothetical protein